MRPDPVSQCAMNAHFGLCFFNAVSTISPVTDCPWGTSITVTLAACGFKLSLANSSLVAAFIRNVRASIPENVPFENATTVSPGITALNIQSKPLQPVPATPNV